MSEQIAAPKGEDLDVIQELPQERDFTALIADLTSYAYDDGRTYFSITRGEALRVAKASAESAALRAEVATLSSRCESLQAENIKLLNDASRWRNRAIEAEEEIREGGRGIDLRRGFER